MLGWFDEIFFFRNWLGFFFACGFLGLCWFCLGFGLDYGRFCSGP